MATVVGILCRCCGNSIKDHRERRKLKSPAGVAILPTLTKLLNKHFDSKMSSEEAEQVLFPPGTEPYICRQPCLAKLQRLQKMENDVVELKAAILCSFDSQSLRPAQHPTMSTQLLGKRTPTQAGIEALPPKRIHTETPIARKQLNFEVPPAVGKSPGVTVN